MPNSIMEDSANQHDISHNAPHQTCPISLVFSFVQIRRRTSVKMASIIALFLFKVLHFFDELVVINLCHQ
jgi:hypothetical protein